MEGIQQNNWDKWLDEWFLPLLFLGIIANFSALFVTILDTDGTLYATIAKTMAQSGDFVNLKVEGKDWLDKPHFPFWMAAISYKIFGITTFGYKFPALLFWALGGYYTYLLAQQVYNKSVAQLAVLVYVSATHLVVSNNDVRAEPYLTGLIVGSVYHYYKASNKKNGIDIIVGSFLAACAVMTKGYFVLITITGGFIADWLITKNYRQFANIRWWLAIVLVCIFTLPEIYCLYVQFDLHPEKVVFERTGVSGLKFFFWDSQFGRFFNTGPIKGDGDKFFYIHTLLWAFLPWSLVFYSALFWRFKHFKTQLVNKEYFILFSGLITLLIFSVSKFQLPHYTNILFPFFAIITAQYLLAIEKTAIKRIFSGVQIVVSVLLLLLVALLWWFFKPTHATAIVVAWLVVAVMAFVFYQKNSLPHAIGSSFWVVMGVYFFINLSLYPNLLQYQSGSEAAYYANQNYPNQPVVLVNATSYSFTFYSKSVTSQSSVANLIKQANNKQPLLIYTEEKNLDSLRNGGFIIQKQVLFPFFHASQLTGEFLNKKTRSGTLKSYAIAQVALQ